MKVTTVSASLRFSKEIGRGRFKTVELSAEAELTPEEDWQEAQTDLYKSLGQQLKALWTRESNLHPVSEGGNNPNTSEAPHYCQVHNVDFQRYEKNGKVWYAHRAEDGWCNEAKMKVASGF